MTRRSLFWNLTIVLGLLMVSRSRGIACDNPVFRYALQNWAATDFELFLIEVKAPDTKELAAWNALQAAVTEASIRPNLRLSRVTLDDANRTFEGTSQEKLVNLAENTLMLLSPPWKGERRAVWTGPCTPESVERITHSPARQELGQRLLDGEAIVWVWLKGADSDSIEANQATLEDFLVGYSSTVAAADLAAEAEAASRPAIVPPAEKVDKSAFWPPRFSSIVVNADDPREAVLVGMLRGVLGDQATSNEPVVFPIFGRGRALGGLPASQLNEVTLRSACDFLTSACSCEVKEKNPGDDLLMTNDWSSVSPDSASGGLLSLIALEPEPASKPQAVSEPVESQPKKSEIQVAPPTKVESSPTKPNDTVTGTSAETISAAESGTPQSAATPDPGKRAMNKSSPSLMMFGYLSVAAVMAMLILLLSMRRSN